MDLALVGPEADDLLRVRRLAGRQAVVLQPDRQEDRHLGLRLRTRRQGQLTCSLRSGGGQPIEQARQKLTNTNKWAKTLSSIGKFSVIVKLGLNKLGYNKLPVIFFQGGRLNK